MFEQKIKRQVSGQETITDWFTLDQLCQFYTSPEVGKAVAESRTEEETKSNPNAPNCKKAKLYKVTLQKFYARNEKESTQGMSFQGDLDKTTDKEKEGLQTLGDYVDGDDFGDGSSLKDASVAAGEKEQKRKPRNKRNRNAWRT